MDEGSVEWINDGGADMTVINPFRPKSKIWGSSKKLVPSITKLFCFHLGLRFSGDPVAGL
jgi:hypothetical protein